MMNAMKILCVSAVVALSAMAADAQDQRAPFIANTTVHHPALGYNGMVVSQEFNASEAGLLMLKKGGNAIDAAVATAFGLAVTYPRAGNIGGGGFMMIYLKAEDRVLAVDFREMAPALASRDMFLDEKGNADNNKARWSPSASAVPGTVAGLLYVQAKYGKLRLQEVMAPAIKLAEDGFAVPWNFFRSLHLRRDRLHRSAASKKYFFKPDGSNYQVGELFVQKDLARTLKTIAEKGHAGFYKGDVAAKIVASMQKTGGLISLEDLANYRVVERDAVSIPYKDLRVYSMPPPSSGGAHVMQLLNILEGYDLASLGHNSAAYIHTLVEAMKYAYADRSKYLGDPDFYDVPMEALLDKKYAAYIRSKIKPDRATPSTEISPAPKLPYESNETTHISVADKMGNVVSTTTTLNFAYGNGFSVAGAGFVLNNEMDDFSIKPGSPNGFGLLGNRANEIAPGKRPLSSMTPTLVMKAGKPYIVTGGPGGGRIITSVLQNILNIVEFGMNPMEANIAPRFHHQWYPDAIRIEPGFSQDTLGILLNMGHVIPLKEGKSANDVIGGVMSIVIEDNLMRGAADPRRGGAHAAVY